MKHIRPGKVLVNAGAILAALVLGATISYAATAATISVTTPNAVGNVNDQTAIATTTTPNLGVGVNDQTLTVGTTTANVPQVKASRTLSIVSVPSTYAASTTIGSCVITYSTSTSDSLNCSTNAATVNTTTHNTISSLATALAGLTNIGSANGHGPLTVSTSTTSTVTISTAGTEASSTNIAFLDGTNNAVISAASTNGTVPVAEVLSLTPGGTVEAGDTFTVTNPSASFSVTHTVPGTATSTSGEANGIANQFLSYGGYGSLGFTVSTSSGMVLLTSTATGTPFYVIATTTNRAAVAQVSTVTIGGTAEVGDAYYLVTPAGTVEYTNISSDTSNAFTAYDLLNTLQTSSIYASEPFTASRSGAVITFTAKTPGTGFALTASATNGTAQVVTFTFPSISTNTTYSVTLNGNTYSYTGASASAVASGLASASSGDAAVTCGASGSTLVCTAKTPGIAFTYSTNATDVVVSSGGGGGGGGGSSGQSISSGSSSSSSVSSKPTTVTTTTGTPVTTVSTVGTITPVMVGGAGKVTLNLRYLSRNNSVKALQQLLTADPNIHYTSGVTGYYGLKTQTAVELFQLIYGVVTSVNDPGYGMVGPKTRAALIRVYGK